MFFPAKLARDLTVIVSVPYAKTTGQFIQFHWPIQWKEKINKASCLREMTQLRTESGWLFHNSDQPIWLYQVTLRPLAPQPEVAELTSSVSKPARGPYLFKRLDQIDAMSCAFSVLCNDCYAKGLLGIIIFKGL